MAQTFTGRKRVRKFFGKIAEVAEMPNLIEVQKASYDQFLQFAEPQAPSVIFFQRHHGIRSFGQLFF